MVKQKEDTRIAPRQPLYPGEKPLAPNQKVGQYYCQRCGKTWFPRVEEGPPKVCAKCKNPRYFLPYVEDEGNEISLAEQNKINEYLAFIRHGHPALQRGAESIISYGVGLLRPK